MQIAIDAHHIGQHRTGTETYVYHLVKHLTRLKPNGNRYAVYLRAGQRVDDLEANSTFEPRKIAASTTPMRYGLFYPLESWRGRFDLFHSQLSLPPLLRCRAVLTVYDLAYERFPQFFRRRIQRQLQVLVPWSCRRADSIITISESSKRDLVELYKINPQRITVTYPGAAEMYRPMDAAQARGRLEQAYGIHGSFILYVGNLDPRKNLARLVEAFVELKQRNAIAQKLVIVGQKGWHTAIFSAIRNFPMEREIVLTGYVPSADLPAFYNSASVTIYPSLFEGFGLPVVEAMACGAPVITSIGSSLEEIASGAAELVDPYSVSSIAAAMETVANSEARQRQLREAGLARAAGFSFQKMAEQTREVYQKYK
jgi:glycosyltransferase involved in cell wall biosynthesis